MKVEKTHLVIENVRRLMKKQLIQNNVIMLLLFVLFYYFSAKGNLSFFIGIICVLLWVQVAITLYTLITGKPIGTKTGKIVQEFDKRRFGAKRWQRKKVTETVIFSALSVLITVFFS